MNEALGDSLSDVLPSLIGCLFEAARLLLIGSEDITISTKGRRTSELSG